MPAPASDLHKDVNMGDTGRRAGEDCREGAELEGKLANNVLVLIRPGYFLRLFLWYYSLFVQYSFLLELLSLLMYVSISYHRFRARQLCGLLLLEILSKSGQNHFVCIYY